MASHKSQRKGSFLDADWSAPLRVDKIKLAF
jgi:hypothetical protein